MRTLVTVLVLAWVAPGHANQRERWSAFKRFKPDAQLHAASKLPAAVVDGVSGIPNAPSALVQFAVVRRSRGVATVLLYGSEPPSPTAGGVVDPTVRADARGHLALVQLTRNGVEAVVDSVAIAAPANTRLRLADLTRLDGDRRKDAVYSWTKSLNLVQRFGAIIVRGDTLSNLDLGSDSRPRAAIDVTLSCFAPVAGSDARALIVGRRAVGRSQRAGALDSLQAYLPGPDGRYAEAAVYGAAFAEQTVQADAAKAWRKAFRPRPARLSAQTRLGRCPGDGVVVHSRALRPQAAADRFAVLGPFALRPASVRARLAKLRKRVPRAVVVLGVGG